MCPGPRGPYVAQPGVHPFVLHEEVLVAMIRWWRLEVLILSCALLGIAGLEQGLCPEAEGQEGGAPGCGDLSSPLGATRVLEKCWQPFLEGWRGGAVIPSEWRRVVEVWAEMVWQQLRAGQKLKWQAQIVFQNYCNGGKETSVGLNSEKQKEKRVLIAKEQGQGSVGRK